jgi:hypothetical protein
MAPLNAFASINDLIETSCILYNMKKRLPLSRTTIYSNQTWAIIAS